MRLFPCDEHHLSPGRFVLLEPRKTLESPGRKLLLRMVARADGVSVALEPVALMLEDDEVTEILTRENARTCLHVPEWEVGDQVLLDGRPGSILHLVPHDLHVTVKLSEPDGREIYANLIRLDLTPAIAAWLEENPQ